MSDSRFTEGLTFDDVLLQPAATEVMPADVDVAGRIRRDVVRHHLIEGALRWRGKRQRG